MEQNVCTKLIRALGLIRQNTDALSCGDYRELVLTNRQYAFSRSYEGQTVIVAVNNDNNDAKVSLPASDAGEYTDALSGEKVSVENGKLTALIRANGGSIFLPAGVYQKEYEPIEFAVAGEPEKEIKEPEEKLPVAEEKEKEPAAAKVSNTYEEMSIEELQEGILEKMKQNGPVTERMRREVMENVYHNSLVNWIKSFR